MLEKSPAGVQQLSAGLSILIGLRIRSHDHLAVRHLHAQIKCLLRNILRVTGEVQTLQMRQFAQHADAFDLIVREVQILEGLKLDEGIDVTDAVAGQIQALDALQVNDSVRCGQVVIRQI